MPFEEHARLIWHDVVSQRHLRAPLLGALWDLVDPFVPGTGAQRTLSAESDARGLVVRGAGRLRGQDAPSVARFSSAGPVELRVQLGRAAWTATFTAVPHER